jgi:transposase-like protein
MVPPNPFDKRGKSSAKVKPNMPHGKVSGSKAEKAFICGACGQGSIIKNNRAIVQEYRRLRNRFSEAFPKDTCQTQGCENYGALREGNPTLYRKSGRTAKGAQRWKCKACLRTYSVGSSIRRQKHSHANRDILWMLTNGTPISKICDFTELSPRDIYGKIDFIYEQIVDFTARREKMFEGVDWQSVGRRFSSDSQTLHLNWPNKKTRAQIAVQHLCTAHCNSGYIMAAHLALDPEVHLPNIEAEMVKNGDFDLPRAFRDQARVWSQSEFKEYIDKITQGVAIHPLEAPDMDEDLQLPHKGALLRQDILQASHALYIRKCLGKGNERFVFVLDGDSGLALSFVSAFAPWIRDGRADVIVVAFDKHKSNDQRNILVAEGKADLEQATGLSRSLWNMIPAKFSNAIIDKEIEELIRDLPSGVPFEWPFHTKAEPHRRIRILTDRPEMAIDRRARLMRLATLRSVDQYFHKVRSNIRFAARPGHTPSNNGRAWDRHYLYNPETMWKIIEIYRFTHNWMGTHKTKETPAMKLGLAKGKIYAKDLFG